MTDQACDTCLDPINDGDVITYDRINGMTFCAGCSPTWADFQRDPTGFYHTDEIYYTAETAAPVLEAHLANGGSLSDICCPTI